LNCWSEAAPASQAIAQSENNSGTASQRRIRQSSNRICAVFIARVAQVIVRAPKQNARRGAGHFNYR
jgi:hypothetical protein